LPPTRLVRNDAMVTGRIYSVGYEGMTVESLVDRLAGAKVTTLVDVRLNPISRKPGFSRKRLTAALDDAGIEYIHEKDLGNPADNRDSFRDGDGQVGRRRMRKLLSNGSGPALERLVERATGERIAVLCVEREQDRCHREVIIDMALEKNPAIEVIQIL